MSELLREGTNSHFVSSVIGGLRILTKDDHISRRFVLRRGRDKARTYISQKLKDRSLYREGNIIKHIPCVELVKIDAVKCPIVEFKKCDILYRSKLQLPDLIYSSYGPAVVSIFSLDGNLQFDIATPSNILADRKRMFGNLVHKACIQDNYLYIPERVEAVDIDVITLYDKEATDLSGCSVCDKCKSVWDYKFICPDKTYEAIITETINELMSTFRRVPVDENPNLDSNQKSQTIQ